MIALPLVLVMGLAAVMRLVIEKMVECVGKLLQGGIDIR